MKTVDICLATINRPSLLLLALSSLAEQNVPETVLCRLIVVDNSADRSAEEAVRGFAKERSIPTTYISEPRQGISYARNAALAARSGDYVAFFDDDQTAAPNWLTELLQTSERYDADVVFGPVLSVLPEETPIWLKRGRYFDRSRFPTGTPRPTGGTGSVLVRSALLNRVPRQFDPAFGLTGGGDTEFFAYLKQAGAHMVWCDEAIAWEKIPKERANAKWLFWRNYRNGQTYSRTYLPGMSVPQTAGWLVFRTSKVILLLVLTAVLCPASRNLGMRLLLAASRNLGQLSAIFGFRRDEYSKYSKRQNT